MNPKFDHILDECIAAMKDGASRKACLEKYPEHADALSPLLELAERVNGTVMPEATLTARRESERRMLAAFHEKEQQKPVSKSIFSRYTQRRPVDRQPEVVKKERVKMKNKFGYLIAGLVVTIIIATTGVSAASANALPGQALYPVKNSLQQVRLFLTFSEENKVELEEQFHQELIEDVMSVMEDGDDVDVEFTGVVEEIGDGYIVVDGVKVVFDENTMMSEGLEVGDLVEVEGHVMDDGSLLAHSVMIEDDDSSGDDGSSDDEQDDDDEGNSSDDDEDEDEDGDDDDSSDDEHGDDDSSDDDEDDDGDDDSSGDEDDDDGDDDSSDDEYGDDDEDEDGDDDSSGDDEDDDDGEDVSSGDEDDDDGDDDDSSDDEYGDDDEDDDDSDDDSSDDDEDDDDSDDDEEEEEDESDS